MNKLVLTSGKLWRYLSYAACVCLFSNMMIIVINILMRRFLNEPIYGSTEMIRYLSLVTASFALVQNEWFDGNIKMTLLPEKLPQKARNLIMLIVYVLCSVAFIYVSFLLIQQAISKFILWDVSIDLHLPIFVFAAILSGGFIILTVGILFKAVLSAYTFKTGITFNLRDVRTLEQE